jgi:ribosomal protein S12 methylthiotransferase accessory factor YcaO
MALLWSGKPDRYFDVASGVCAHWSASRAVIGAVQEAAQTRISNIAGARDDIDPAEYDIPLPPWIVELLAFPSPVDRALPASLSVDDFVGLPERLGGRAIVVPLTSAKAELHVVKVLAETMEDRSTNAHWRPGARAIRAMTAL